MQSEKRREHRVPAATQPVDEPPRRDTVTTNTGSASSTAAPACPTPAAWLASEAGSPVT